MKYAKSQVLRVIADVLDAESLGAAASIVQSVIEDWTMQELLQFAGTGQADRDWVQLAVLLAGILVKGGQQPKPRGLMDRIFGDDRDYAAVVDYVSELTEVDLYTEACSAALPKALGASRRLIPTDSARRRALIEDLMTIQKKMPSGALRRAP